MALVSIIIPYYRKINHIKKDINEEIQLNSLGRSIKTKDYQKEKFKYENGTQLPYLDSWIIHENKWRATRYGIDAKLILDSEGNQENITTVIKNTIFALEPEINNLQISESMDRIISRINNHHSYYDEQIKLYNKNKSFEDLISNNVEKLKKSI